MGGEPTGQLGPSIAGQTPEHLKQLLDQIAAESEATMNDPMPEGTVYTQPNLAKSVTFSLRLYPDELAGIENIAEGHGVPAATLARSWLVQRLAAEQRAAAPDAGHEQAKNVDEGHVAAMLDEAARGIVGGAPSGGESLS